MFRNHLKIAWRNITKSKKQSIINLLGLTLGTVSCLTILLYVFDQTGYDQYHDNAENIYRLRTKIKGTGVGTGDIDMATSSPPIAFTMKEDFPEVKEACRIVGGTNSETPIRSLESTDFYYAPRAYTADHTLFKMLTYKFTEGNSKTAIREPNTLVLSSSLAKKLFGNQKALNKTVVLGTGEDAQNLKVSAVFDDTFGKSHLNPDYVVSMNTPGLGEFVRTTRNFAAQNFVYSYVRLVPGTNAKQLEEKLPTFLMTHGGEDLAELGIVKTLLLQKVTDIHLHSKGIVHQIDNVSNIQYLYFLLTLALIIQLIACVNFINLSTARVSKRAKEIGVRKVAGADKGSLIRQFLGESLLLSLFAVLISIPITLLLLPMLNELIQGDVSLMDLLNWKFLILLFSLGVFTGFAAGTYPAFILSSIKPIRALKNSANLKSGNGYFRKVLVVFQFVVSIALIICVIIITQQFNYTQNKDLGFDRTNLLEVRLNSDIAKKNYVGLREEFLNIPGVTEVAGTRFSPAEKILSDDGLYLPGKDPQNKIYVKTNRVSHGYFRTMDIPLIAGRDFREGDENQVIVNESTLKAFNIKKDLALNTTLLSTYEGETQEFEVVGVVRDYNYTSLKESIKPLMLTKSNRLNWIILRTKTSNYQQLLTDLEQKWKTTLGNAPLTYAFVDQEIEKIYQEEKRLSKISFIFTFLAVSICCLGLFGLVSYVTEQKKKEIGIRKVLGASINSVVELLTGDFVKLVGIALLIASPLAYFFMQRWLEDFSYRIDIPLWVFPLAGGFALIITLLTVGFQSIKAAMANPVKSLRTE